MKLFKKIKIMLLFVPCFAIANSIVVSVPDATQIDLDSVTHSFNYNGPNLISDTVIAVSKQTRVPTYYTQSLEYSGLLLISTSQWIMGNPVSFSRK
jgi:hypothetical protein